MFRWQIYFVMLVTLAPLFASTWRCRLGFSNLAGDNVSTDSVGQAYEQIISELGASIKPEIFQKMIDAGKPLQLPDELELGSDSLKTTLKDFSELLENAGLNMKEIEKTLLGVLNRRIHSAQAIETKQRKNDEGNSLTDRIFFPKTEDLRNPQFSPNGKDILAKDWNGGFWLSKKLGPFKRVGGELKEINSKSYKHHVWDGKTLYWQTTDNNIYRIVTHDSAGKLIKNWTSELWMADKSSIFAGEIQLSEDGKHGVFKKGGFGKDSGVHTFSIDAPSRKRGPLIFKGGKLPISVIKMIPEKESIIIFDNETISHIDMKGKKMSSTKTFNWVGEEEVNRLNLGNEDVAINQKRNKAYAVNYYIGPLEIDLMSGKIKRLKLLEELTYSPHNLIREKRPHFKSVVLDKDEKYLYMIVDKSSLDGGYQLVTFELESSKIVGVVDLFNTPVERLHYNSDRSTILVEYVDFNLYSVYATKDLTGY